MPVKRTNVSILSRYKIAERQNNNCSQCLTKLGHRYHIDHIKALHLGGTNHSENLQALCFVCHDLKTLKEMIRYNQTRHKKCQYCNIKLNNRNNDLNVNDSHQCLHSDIKRYESIIEFKTRESKYFIQGLYSFDLIN